MRLLILVLMATITLCADSEGPNSPASEDGGGWNNAFRVFVQDGSESTGSFNDNTVFSNFSFSIPTSATIDGLLIEIDAHHTGTDENSITSNGANVGICTAKETAELPTVESDNYISLGGASDTWSCPSLTPANVNSSSFGARIIASKVGGSDPGISTWRLDHIRVTVFFTEAGTTFQRFISVQ